MVLRQSQSRRDHRRPRFSTRLSCCKLWLEVWTRPGILGTSDIYHFCRGFYHSEVFLLCSLRTYRQDILNIDRQFWLLSFYLNFHICTFIGANLFTQLCRTRRCSLSVGEVCAIQGKVTCTSCVMYAGLWRAHGHWSYRLPEKGGAYTTTTNFTVIIQGIKYLRPWEIMNSTHSFSIHDVVGTPQARTRSHCIVLAPMIPVQSGAHVLWRDLALHQQSNALSHELPLHEIVSIRTGSHPHGKLLFQDISAF